MSREVDAENVLLVPEPGRGIGGRTGRVFPGPSTFRDVVREKTQKAGPAGRVETSPADGRVEAGEHGFPAFSCVIESAAADEGGDSALCNGPEADAGEGIKFPAKLKFYFTWILPFIVLVVFVVGYIQKFA